MLPGGRDVNAQAYVNTSPLASELAHEDGFLYVALRAPRGVRDRGE
jgi:hypothetical protein